MEVEISDWDLLFADVHAAMEELTEAPQHQERLQGELSTWPSWICKESMSKVNDSRSLHDVVCQDLQAETRRNVEDAHDSIRTHKDRCLETAEEDLNDSLGRMCQLIKDTAVTTYSLSCGVPDRE